MFGLGTKGYGDGGMEEWRNEWRNGGIRLVSGMAEDLKPILVYDPFSWSVVRKSRYLAFSLPVNLRHEGPTR
jgi:hypothetical protein